MFYNIEKKHTYLKLFNIFINNEGTFMFCHDLNIHTDFWLYKIPHFCSLLGYVFSQK
jgi:hypothetical protein